MKEDLSLLLRAALSENESAAQAAWRAWRTSRDVQHLSWSTVQIIPLLNGPRFHEWLEGDPDAGIFQGIVRRAWTEAQVRLALAHEVAAQLERAGCDPVVLIGPAAVYLRNSRKDSVRPISNLRLLIGRRAAPSGANVLQSAGWKLHGEMPAPDALDWSMFTSFSRDGVELYLHWRVVPGSETSEREFLKHNEILEAGGMSFRVLTPGYALLAAVAGRLPDDADVIPWQVDAALIPRGEIAWKAWSGDALGKLEELRALGVKPPRPSLRERIWRLFR